MPASNPFYLFNNQTTDGISNQGSLEIGGNREAIVQCYGTWDGANIIIQNRAFSLDPLTAPWLQLNDLSGNPFAFTSNGQQSISGISQNEPVRAVLSNAGASTSITVVVRYT